MGKTSTKFVCQNCGNEALKWAGRCNGRGEWNTLVETVVSAKISKHQFSIFKKAEIVHFKDIQGKDVIREKTHIIELDRVLGGGLVPGSVVLLAGEPGIGKSTLLTQLALKLENVLYVCGEESPEQIKLRINRLSIKDSPSLRKGESLNFLASTDVDAVVEEIKNLKIKPSLVIVDSVQTMATGDLTGMAGSVGQIRECAYRLLNMAKEIGVPVFWLVMLLRRGRLPGRKYWNTWWIRYFIWRGTNAMSSGFCGAKRTGSGRWMRWECF